MSKIIKVNLNDELRTLLTDVLPYELPLWYTNYPMHYAFTNHLDIYVEISQLSHPVKKKDASTKQNLIPMNYSIFRGENKSPRILSIMHPISQILTCLFYSEHSSLINYYCTKSKKSLRFPFRVSTKFYGKIKEDAKLSTEIEMYEDEPKTSSSYFKYLKYPFLYRFFESYEYHKLEKRFSNMMQVDVAKCFPSIYTHTIGWATKNKRLAKEKSDGSFDSSFDNLMQNMNYRETNGIIVGPEVCRIFSEVILQQIDIDIIQELKDSNELDEGVDFDFRRYVDDYFVFYRDKEVGDHVLRAINKSLLAYKLHLNDNKTIYESRPFATKISIAKEELKSCIKMLSESRKSDTGELIANSRPDMISNKYISKIKMVLRNGEVEYHSISNYLLKSLENMSNSFINDTSSASITHNHVNWLLVDLDLLFFFHAMDIRIRTTDKLAKQVSHVLYSVETWESDLKDIIYKKIFDQVKQAIDIFIAARGEVYGLETLNLLVILSLLPERYILDSQRLQSYYEKQVATSSHDDFYFRWVTFMLYINNRVQHAELQTQLEREAVSYLDSNEDLFKSTQFFLLFFDFCSCPMIEKTTKIELTKSIKNKTGNGFSDAKRKHIFENDFIAPWRDSDYLQKALSKREFTFTYN